MKFLKIAFFLSLLFITNTNYAADIITNLNQDWNNVKRQGCNIKDPDYVCSGIIIHVFDMLSFQKLAQSSPKFTTDYNPWMPSEEGIKKGSVSFSYLRRDIAVEHSLYPGPVPAGYIFMPISRLKQNKAPKLYDIYCEYPINAASNNRDNKGCGFWGFKKQPHNVISLNQTIPTDLGSCKDLGVDTAEKYINQPIPYCSLSPDQAGFDLMLNIIKYLKDNKIELVNDEIVIGEWSTYSDAAVPIEAFFYTTEDPNNMGETAAYNAAMLYKQKTGISVPVIQIDVQKLDQGEAEPFTSVK